MPSRQLQPAAHSLLAGYLLLRISLHERLLWNILGPAAEMACICLYSSYSEGFFLFFFCIHCLSECLQPRRTGGDLSLSTMTMLAIKNIHSTL